MALQKVNVITILVLNKFWTVQCCLTKALVIFIKFFQAAIEAISSFIWCSPDYMWLKLNQACCAQEMIHQGEEFIPIKVDNQIVLG